MYIDSHSHWSDPRIKDSDILDLLTKSKDKNITSFMLGGIDPDDWHRQIEINLKFEKTFYPCFGLHPYFVSKSNYEDCENALDELAKLVHQSLGLGETGLDFREKILVTETSSSEETAARQIEFFENQIQLAKVYHKPLVLHIVQAHEKSLQVFDIWGAPQSQGMVHAFNSSFEIAKKYIDLGFYISIGGAVTFEKNKKLHDTIQKLPLESLLLESDSPDQAPKDWQGLNDSSSLWQIAEVVGKLKNISTESVLKISTDNFKKLFSL